MFTNDNDPASDQHFLSELRKGNTDAFDMLYDKYWKRIYSTAFKRLPDNDQAKDITQDVFLQLWLKREENYIDNLPAYLFTAVRNKVFNLMQKEKRFTALSELILLLKTANDSADSVVLKKEFITAYEALINQLTPAQQKAFRMYYQQDISTIEIAKEMAISRKTVQNQLGKAVVRLKASFLSTSKSS